MAEVLDTRLVSVAASRIGQRQAKFTRDDLANLGVQALAHLGAAVRGQHGAVGVNMHQRASLVEVGGVERMPDFHQGQRQTAALERGAGGINSAIAWRRWAYWQRAASSATSAGAILSVTGMP